MTLRPKHDVKRLAKRKGRIQMKYYTLNAVVQGKAAKLKKSIFSSRNEAIDYMFKYYRNHFIYNIEVNEEYMVGNDKHSIEYVCDYYNRFTITRNIEA